MDAMLNEWPSLELKNDGDTAAEDTAVEKALADFTTSANERIEAAETKAADALKRAEAAELAAKRRGAATDDDPKAGERKAFNTFIRSGREALTPDEVKDLRVSPDTSGGYLAPSDFQTEIIKQIVELSPVRQAARVGQTSAGEVTLPKRTGTPTGHWVGETETRSETGSTYGQIEIPVHEMAAYVDVSQRLLEDAAVNIEAEVSADLAEEFARLEAVAFVNGTGAKQPTGFTTDTAVSEVASGDTSKVTADGLVDLFYSLKAAYRSNAVWMMNGATIGAVRKLKSSDGQYYWTDSLTNGAPGTILGRPVIEAPGLEDIGAGKHPIYFGDFNRAYRIYDRVGLSIMRDPYSVATSGLVRFHARRRVGGALVLAEAIAKQKIATS